MAGRIKSDVLHALDNWKAGKEVRSVELGHIHRMKENPGMSPSIDMSEHIHLDQERAHAYCFHILEQCKANLPDNHDTFLEKCNLLRLEFEGLLLEEAEAAESLAWKALIVGWQRALDGHREAHYIAIKKPEEPKKKRKTA